MPTPISEAKNYSHITGTQTLTSTTGELLGIFVASASSTPTIAVSDGSAVMVNTFTPSGGTFYPMPARFLTSLIVTISGTVDCTVFWAN